MEKKQGFKSGFVNIVGNPNVGKSTLMNLLVDERLSIVTHKSQTTRHRIMGIVNTPDMQIVYSDTPGVLAPRYKLQEQMRAYSNSALQDADILLYVTDVVETPDKHLDFIAQIKKLSCPIIVLINKIDLTTPDKLEALTEEWHQLLEQAEILPISALNAFNIAPLKKRIAALLPESPAYFDQEQLTDRPAKFFVSEIIREKILRYYKQEIPYAVEIVVDRFKETDTRIDIEAVILTERDSQRGILIGKGGRSIKGVGKSAREDLEKFFQKHIRLELFVKVAPDWRNDTRRLSDFGYISD